MTNSKANTLVDSICYGKSEQAMCAIDGGTLVHGDIVKPLQLLKQAADDAGFNFQLASGYRSFERQSDIWNAKLSGVRPLLDENSRPLELDNLNSLERVTALMRWSALPGSSRHHWGTDFDIYDKAAIDSDYVLQLNPEEYTHNGPFAPMMLWLKKFLHSSEAPDFFLPYEIDGGGVRPEPWHISYRPLAETFQQHWSKQKWTDVLEGSSILEKDTVLENLEDLYQRFVYPSIYC